MKKSQFQYDMIFEFINNITKMSKDFSLSIAEIREAMDLNKSSCNNNLQYLFKNKAIDRHNVNGETRYYSIITLEDYTRFCEVYRKEGGKNYDKIAKDIYKFIYSGCPERIGKNLNIRI